MRFKAESSRNKRRNNRRTSVLQVGTGAKSSPVGLPAGAILLFGGLFLLMLGWGLWLMFSWMGELLFTRNDRFILHQVEARSDGLLPETILQGWTGVRPGENLYEVDLDNVRKRLEKQAIVRRAVVQRKLPDTLSVAVNERVPLARMGQVEGRMNWLVDEEGIVIKKSFESKHLPFLLGVDQNVNQGDDISGGAGGPVLPYLQALREMPGKIRDLLPVHVVNVGHPDYLDFRLKDGFQIKFPRDGNIEDLIMEASRGIYEIQNQGLRLNSLDMRPQGQNKIGAPE
ncbi:MAG: cell division protein FtsQ/DivIB [Kiritimatiellia bacterium]